MHVTCKSHAIGMTQLGVYGTVVSRILVPIDICALHSITWIKYWKVGLHGMSTCFNIRVSLSFQYFTHMIKCNAQTSIGTRNREITASHSNDLQQHAQCLTCTTSITQQRRHCYRFTRFSAGYYRPLGRLKRLAMVEHMCIFSNGKSVANITRI